jgi:sugar phosphate isomerase/epimerase
MSPNAIDVRLRRDDLDRRTLLRATACGLAALATFMDRSKADEPARGDVDDRAGKDVPTRFQIACMTLPYAHFPLARALSGIKASGYRYVAWGTTHREGTRDEAVMPADAAPERARELGSRCRDLGLEPLMMFSGVYPEAADAPDVFLARIRQAAAGGVPQVLTFGHTQGGNRRLWVERFKRLGPVARDHGVTIVVKQHGGETGTGAACASIVREVGDEGIKVNYDAGNVMDYLDVDPIPDIEACADQVRSFCIKDHRNFPMDQDCGPGFGVIDHYRLLHPFAYGGKPLPLCCENISPPLLAPPTDPAVIDTMALRAREFLEIVTRGIQQSSGPAPRGKPQIKR